MKIRPRMRNGIKAILHFWQIRLGGPLLLASWSFLPASIQAANTIGLVESSSSALPGYTLFAPLFSTRTYLIDVRGNLVHRWISPYLPGVSAYLLENGHLLRAAYLNSGAFATA